ncbi:hypothetical protein [Lentibacillus sp. Marseille-P4043]|uniref:hypothetical protein n=1 Tax=Lentibacillus sp. Marseille-P4043 TaxID=2040293 RepID=UPI000D0ABB55|nr:hypothetical protein [Lentibacillus sp. Marseille-P4043]
MNNFKNQRGAAFVITLMIITLFLLFILTQFHQVTNTTKQVTIVEKTLDAQLIAEMGVDYYRELVDKYIQDEEIKDPNKITLPEPNPPTIDSNHAYQISAYKMIEKSDTKVIITFRSTGIAFDKEKQIDDKITIHFAEE